MVRGYLQEGLLSSERKGRVRYLNPVEVEELRVEKAGAKKGRVLPSVELQQLKVRIHRMESQLTAVLRILDAKDEPLGLQGEAASQIHAACQARLRGGDWSLQEIKSWLEILLRITEEDFHEIRAAASITQPWRPFLQLCHLLLTVVGKHEVLRTSVELQTMHRSLGEAKRRLRIAAVLFIESKGGAVEDVNKYLMDAPASIVDAVETALKRAKTSAA
jgi:hypothetical protein